MVSLRAAATLGDAALDLALMRVGILAPVDLDPIRAVLTQPACGLRATANHHGHCVIEITVAGSLSALIHHDGSVLALASAA